MSRYGYFELRSSCGSCGQPMPVNGPLTSVSCSYCFKENQIQASTIADFINDLEDDYEGLAEGTGHGGTLMGGDGTFKYKQQRRQPHCKGCKSPLPEVPIAQDGGIYCPQCGTSCDVYPAPAWLIQVCPSVVQVLGAERPPAAPGAVTASVDQQQVRPIAMACPKCGAGLSITSEHARVHPCDYCKTDVFIPDELWKRLHPVKEVSGWWVRYEGPSRQERLAQQRAREQQEEQAALARRRNKPGPSKSGRSASQIPTGVFLTSAALNALGIGLVVIAMTVGRRFRSELQLGLMLVGGVFFAAGVLTIIIVKARKNLERGKGKVLCRAAMELVCQQFGWTFHGKEVSAQHHLGTIHEELHGRDVELDPDDDGIEVELHSSPFFLGTEASEHDSPPDEMRRFTTGDFRFDETFPIRYATLQMADAIERGQRASLEPFFWYLERWKPRLARLQVDESDINLHVHEGRGKDKYIPGEELQPLLLDTVELAKGIELTSHGRPWSRPQYAPLTPTADLLAAAKNIKGSSAWGQLVGPGAFAFLPLIVVPVVLFAVFTSGEVTGQLQGSGSLLGDFTLAPDTCSSGQHDGFFGVWVGSTRSSEEVIKLYDDPRAGRVAIVQIPGSCKGPECKRVALDAKTCQRFTADIERTSTTINDVRVLDARLTLDCQLDSGDQISGSLTIEGCH